MEHRDEDRGRNYKKGGRLKVYVVSGGRMEGDRWDSEGEREKGNEREGVKRGGEAVRRPVGRPDAISGRRAALDKRTALLLHPPRSTVTVVVGCVREAILRRGGGGGVRSQPTRLELGRRAAADRRQPPTTPPPPKEAKSIGHRSSLSIGSERRRVQRARVATTAAPAAA